MKVLIDNTLLHRVGTLVESSKSDIIRSVDILALFHVVEHILFAEEIFVPSFKKMFSHERTSEVINFFHKEGFSTSDADDFLRLDSWNADSYIDACAEASWRALDELTSFDIDHLRSFKGYVDDASNPDRSNIYDFNEILSEEYAQKTDINDLKQFIKDKGTGTIQYMILFCEPLRRSLKNMQEKANGFNYNDSLVLTTTLRVKVYQELAEKNYNGFYSPSPQRAKIVEINNLFYRYRLEKAIEKYVSEHGQYSPPNLIKELQALNSLPLPLFAIHALRNSNANSPYAVLEHARKMRDDDEIRSIRQWLTKWDDKLTSEKQHDRLDALNKLNQFGDDIKHHLQQKKYSMIADLRPGLETSIDPMTGLPVVALNLLPALSEFLGLISKRFEKNRMLIPVLAGDLLTNETLGRRILKLVNRPIGK